MGQQHEDARMTALAQMDAGCSKPRFRLAAHCLGWEFKGINSANQRRPQPFSVFSGDEFTHLGNQLLTVLHGIWNRVVATDEQARCSELIIPQHRFGNRIRRPYQRRRVPACACRSREFHVQARIVYIGCSCRVQRRCEPTFCGVGAPFGNRVEYASRCREPCPKLCLRCQPVWDE